MEAWNKITVQYDLHVVGVEDNAEFVSPLGVLIIVLQGRVVTLDRLEFED